MRTCTRAIEIQIQRVSDKKKKSDQRPGASKASESEKTEPLKEMSTASGETKPDSPKPVAKLATKRHVEISETLRGHMDLVKKVSAERAMYYLMLKELSVDGTLNLSQVKIARALDVSEVTIKRAIRALIDADLMTEIDGHSTQKAKTYRIH